MAGESVVYKGYRLTARVVRAALDESPVEPRFRASVAIGLASDSVRVAEEFPIPMFAAGGFASSPRVAAEAALLHGRYLVDNRLSSWA